MSRDTAILKPGLHRLISEFLNEGFTVRIIASGTSMYPAIRPGDIIDIVPVGGTGDLIKPGEVIALNRDDDMVVHRFIGYFERGGRRWVFTRGDSVLRADEPVPAEAVAGRVVAVTRGNGEVRKLRPLTNVFYRWNRLMVKGVMGIKGLLRH
jgi:signal peptidase I